MDEWPDQPLVPAEVFASCHPTVPFFDSWFFMFPPTSPPPSCDVLQPTLSVRSCSSTAANIVQQYCFLRTYAPFRSLTFLPIVAIELTENQCQSVSLSLSMSVAGLLARKPTYLFTITTPLHTRPQKFLFKLTKGGSPQSPYEVITSPINLVHLS